jgi:hypothetical protein
LFESSNNLLGRKNRRFFSKNRRFFSKNRRFYSKNRRFFSKNRRFYSKNRRFFSKNFPERCCEDSLVERVLLSVVSTCLGNLSYQSKGCICLSICCCYLENKNERKKD